MEYIEQPAVVKSESDVVVTESPTQSPLLNIDYPYNQDRQPFIDVAADSNNYADYSPAVFKEAPADENVDGEENEQPEVLEKTLDYPYNQLLVPDIFGNPTALVHDKKKGTAAVGDKTIHDTVHSPHHQLNVEEGQSQGHGRRQQQQQPENATHLREKVVDRLLPAHHGSRGGGSSVLHHRSAPVPVSSVNVVDEIAPAPDAPVSIADVIAPLKIKDSLAMPSADAAMTSRFQRPIGRQGGEAARLQAKEGDDGLDYENMGNLNGHLNQQIGTDFQQTCSDLTHWTMFVHYFCAYHLVLQLSNVNLALTKIL